MKHATPTTAVLVGGPAWAPDSIHLAFGHRGSVWVVRTTGGPAARIAAGSSYAWSPDSTWLAYSDGTNVTVSRADGSTPTKVTALSATKGGLDSRIAWNAVSRSLASVGRPR